MNLRSKVLDESQNKEKQNLFDHASVMLQACKSPHQTFQNKQDKTC